MKCTLGDRPHHHVEAYVRQGSVQGATVPAGAELWVRTAELPPNEAWNHLFVYDCRAGKPLASALVDRSRQRCKVQLGAQAALEAIRAIVLRRGDFPGRPPHEGDPGTLGDGNGAAPRVQP